MADNSEFQRQAERVNTLVSKISELPDNAARATALELLQELMNLHATVFERMLEITAGFGEVAGPLVESFARDPLVSGMMVLYDLHPESAETRIARAIEGAGPSLRSHGGAAELIEVRDGVVRVRLTSNGSRGCGSTTEILKNTIEQAIYQAAPDAAVVFETADQPSGFVPLAQLTQAA